MATYLGYLMASTMLEQEGAYELAIELCRQAQSEGWGGNWPWRIQQLNRKLCETGRAVKSVSSSGITRL